MAVQAQRVLLVHRYFAPDVTTYAQMLDRFGQRLADQGHDVTVLCGPPSYNNAYKGELVARRVTRGAMTIRRVRAPKSAGRWGKLAGHMIFPLLVLGHVLSRRRPYEVVSVTTMPPLVMGIVGRLSRLRSRRTRFVYHCMDLYPEVAQASGLLANPRLVSAAQRIDRSTMESADQVLVLSEDMATAVRGRDGDAEIAVANNFSLITLDEVDASHSFERRTDRVRFVFAGNLGRFQGIGSLIEAIQIVALERSDFEFVFMGAGVEAERLRAAERDGLPIEVWDHRPIEQAAAVIEDADVAVVSLDPGVIRSAYPSKVMTYLMLGRPLLAVVERDSQLGTLIANERLGRVVDPRDPTEIAVAIAEIIGSCDEYDSAKIAAVGAREFDPGMVMDRWAELYGLAL